MFPAPPASIISIGCLSFLYSGARPQPASSATAACRFCFSQHPAPSASILQLPAIALFPATPPSSLASAACVSIPGTLSCLSVLYSRHPQPASSASAACRFYVSGTPSQHHQHQLPAVSQFSEPPASIISIGCLPFLFSRHPQPASSASAACGFSIRGTPCQHHQHQLPAVSLCPVPAASITSIRCLLVLCCRYPQPASSASAACHFSIPGTPSQHHQHEMPAASLVPAGTPSQHHQHQLPAVFMFPPPPASIISISWLPFLCSRHPQPASSASAACRFSIPGPAPSQHHQQQLPVASVFPSTRHPQPASFSCLPLLYSRRPRHHH